MDSVFILRVLWLRRLLVAAGLVLAVCVGVFMSYEIRLGLPPGLESRQYDVGIASAAVLIDSPSSQAADLGDGGDTGPKADVASLAERARLLAALVATSPLKDQIAVGAGVSPNTLIARAPGIGVAPEPTPLSSGSTVSPNDPRANILTITVNDTLPILSADSQAPTAAAAARISSAAVAALEPYLQSVASEDRVPSARQLVVKRLGPARYATVGHGPRRLLAVVATFFLFAAWCAAIVGGVALARSWREAAARDEAVTDEPLPDFRSRVQARTPFRDGLRRRRPDDAEGASAGSSRARAMTAPPVDDEMNTPTPAHHHG